MARVNSIYLPGFGPRANPIPMGAKVGNVIHSSSLWGIDPKTKIFPANLDEQAELLFKNITSFMEEAGGSPENIVFLRAFIRKERHREAHDALNKPWLKMFPDENHRPARHTMWGDHLYLFDAKPECQFMAEVLAVA
jgi:2-iminobutanoate/2-iminopropanoate deaminase